MNGGWAGGGPVAQKGPWNHAGIRAVCATAGYIRTEKEGT